MAQIRWIAAGSRSFDCRIAASWTLSHCLIGSRVVLAPRSADRPGRVRICPHTDQKKAADQSSSLVRVVIGNDVDIGANTTIGSGNPDRIRDRLGVDD